MNGLVGLLFTAVLVIAIGYWTIKGFRKEVQHIKDGCCGSADCDCSSACGSSCGCGLSEKLDNQREKV
ncbi:hypothetical protein V6C27_11280 [Peptococcaceae bacterium 1198_IL3148]